VRMSCYLTFDLASNGTLFTHWSQTPVPDALASFTPSKPIPKFKFTQNAGRTELIRTINGPNLPRYYQGWVQFVKMARENDAEFMVLKGEQFTQAPVALYIVTKNTDVSRIAENTPATLGDVASVSAVHPSNMSYGVKKMNVALFRETAESSKGAAIQF